MALNNEAWLRVAWLGQYATAEKLATSARVTFESHGDTRGLAQSLTILAGVHFAHDDANEAVSLASEAVALLDRAQDYWLEAQALRELALIQIMSGLTAEAAGSAQRGLELCSEVGLPDLAPGLHALLAWTLLEEGHLDRAMQVSPKAVATLGRGVEFSHLVHYVHSLTLRSADRIPEADEHLLQAGRLVDAALSDVPAGDRGGSDESVRLLSMILTAAKSREPRYWTGPWPRADAPLGRGLREGDYTTVTLTTWQPSDEAARSERAARQAAAKRIIEEASSQGSVPGVVDIAEVLGVSVATVRRDLKALRDSGVPIRTRGSDRT